ncbi:MAG: hypothetical protein RIQ62_222 [Bacteroidota bacterium]
MKKVIFGLLLTITFIGYRNIANALKLNFQTRAHGVNCEKDRGLCIQVEISPAEIAALGLLKAWQADATCTGSFLNLKTTELETPWGGNDFIVDSDIKLSDVTAQYLGYKSITIKKGTYFIDFSKNNLGDLKLNVVTQ